MVKTVLKIDGMMCGMCESHMNDLIRNHCKVKKVSSSAKKGETVVISEEKRIVPSIRITRFCLRLRYAVCVP